MGFSPGRWEYILNRAFRHLLWFTPHLRSLMSLREAEFVSIVERAFHGSTLLDPTCLVLLRETELIVLARPTLFAHPPV